MRPLPPALLLAVVTSVAAANPTSAPGPRPDGSRKIQEADALLDAQLLEGFNGDRRALGEFNAYIQKNARTLKERSAVRLAGAELLRELGGMDATQRDAKLLAFFQERLKTNAVQAVQVVGSRSGRQDAHVESTQKPPGAHVQGNPALTPAPDPPPGKSPPGSPLSVRQIQTIVAQAIMQATKVGLGDPSIGKGPPGTPPGTEPLGDPKLGSGPDVTADPALARAELLGRYLVDIDASDGRARELLALSAWRRGDAKTAYEEIARAIAAGRVGPSNFLLRGLAAEQLSDFEQANSDARVTLEFDPKSQRARDLLHMTDGKASGVRLGAPDAPWSGEADADELLSASNVGGAARSPATLSDPMAIIAEVQGRSGGNPRRTASNLVREARRYLDVKDARTAIAIATKALDHDPKNAAAYHVRAVAEGQTGRLNEAVRDASLSLALVTPKQGFPALKTRAWAYNGLRKFDNALKDSLQAKSIKPGDGFVLMSEARALGGLGRRDEMVARLQEAAAVEPERYQALYEAALELPSDADTETLFTGLPSARGGKPGGKPSGGRWHKVRLLVYCLAGGLLIALGLSHKDVAERATTTARRLFTGGAATGERGAEPAPAAPAPSTNFWARYDGAREIAKGGMGIVYEATDKNLGRRVAVKKMREELRTDPRERERFLKEARTVASLQHPNVVQIFEVVEDGLDAYLVFEFVDGETLHDRLRRLKRLSLPDTAKILAGVCAAVECAHGRAMTHRDLKPSNIMIARDGLVKVMDFGIARHAKDALTKLSMTNTVCGTPPYMAPEQEQGMVCKESDVFSLGVLAYELLSGALPFEGAPGAMLLAKMSGRYEPVAKRVKELPAGVDEALARALRPDPAKRYRRPSELATALEALSSAVRS